MPLAAKAVDLRRLRLSSGADRKVKLLKREAEILKRVPEHAHLVRFVDTIVEGEWLFFVLERVDGGDLLNALMRRSEGRRPKLAEAEAQYIFKQLVEGIRFLHSQGVIHRDLKPENVLVARQRRGVGGIILLDVKIADFGLSKFVGEGFSEAQSTVGSPRYMAPEVLASGGSAAGAGAYDFRADLWSLGVLLHVLLDGRFPCDGMPKVAQARIDSAIARLDGVSAQARSVLSGLLRLKPEDRLGGDDLRRHPWLLAAPAASTTSASTTGAARAAKQAVAHAVEQRTATPATLRRRRRSSSSSMGGSSSCAGAARRPPPRQPGPSRGLKRRLSESIFSAGDNAAIVEATTEVEKVLASPKSRRGASSQAASSHAIRDAPKAAAAAKAKGTAKEIAKRNALTKGRAKAKGRAGRLWGERRAMKK